MYTCAGEKWAAAVDDEAAIAPAPAPAPPPAPEALVAEDAAPVVVAVAVSGAGTAFLSPHAMAIATNSWRTKALEAEASTATSSGVWFRLLNLQDDRRPARSPLDTNRSRS